MFGCTEIPSGSLVKLRFTNGEKRYGALMDNRKSYLIYRPKDGVNTIVFHRDLTQVSRVWVQ